MIISLCSTKHSAYFWITLLFSQSLWDTTCSETRNDTTASFTWSYSTRRIVHNHHESYKCSSSFHPHPRLRWARNGSEKMGGCLMLLFLLTLFFNVPFAKSSFLRLNFSLAASTFPLLSKLLLFILFYSRIFIPREAIVQSTPASLTTTSRQGRTRWAWQARQVPRITIISIRSTHK